MFDSFIVLRTKYNTYICWCGSTVEQLTCNQQVVGSIPITSSIYFLGRLQSGQMQRTVNPSSQTSMVRIHPFPPQKHSFECFFVACDVFIDFQSIRLFHNLEPSLLVLESSSLRATREMTLPLIANPSLPTTKALFRVFFCCS